MPLPDYLIDKYKYWKKNSFKDRETLYKNLESNGQKPKAMIISCCDSRVDANSIFNGNPGDLFIHRNIANLIPSYNLNDNNNNKEITASIDYAVLTLKVPAIIILGHSSCGGIKYAYKKFSGNILEKNETALNNWTKSIKPAYEKLNKSQSETMCIKSLEKKSIINSIENLQKYPNIKKLVLENELKIYGLFLEIGSGNLSQYDETTKTFEIIDYL